MELKQRDSQTKVKHAILAEYLADWAGIITSGSARVAQQLATKGIPFRSRFLYVDGFSHTGRYLGDRSELLRGRASDTPTWGSPIIGIQAFDRAREYARNERGLNLETAVILTENDPECFAELRTSLDLAGLTNRVAFNPTQIAPSDGQIVAIESDFLTHIHEIIQVAQAQYTYSFFLLDPYGPKGIPYETVSRIISLKQADVVINFPYQDLHKKAGILIRPPSKKGSPSDDGLLENYDAMFGTRDWRDIVRETADRFPEPQRWARIEAALVTFYLHRLQTADSELAIKDIRLEFPDVNRTMFYLCLTTHNPTGALTMNEVLYNAKQLETGLKVHFQTSKWIHYLNAMAQQGQPSLFDLPADEPPKTTSSMADRRLDKAALADAIWEKFQGQRKTGRQIFTAFASTDVFASEIDKALSQLKKEHRADYSTPRRLDTPVYFKTER